MKRAIALLTVAVSAACGDDKSPSSNAICDAAELATALAAAEPEASVAIGSCSIEGAFVMRPRTRLAGTGSSVLIAPPDRPAIDLQDGIISDLRIESAGRIGLLARSADRVELQRVFVDATRGIALGFEDVTTVLLRDVVVHGPVDETNAPTFPTGVSPNDTATHGLVAIRVLDAQLQNFTVTGFASFGALFVESHTMWNEGVADKNLGVGAFVDGGNATLLDVVFTSTLKGFRLEPAYNLVAAGGATITGQHIDVSRSEGHGMLIDASAANLVEFFADSNAESGVWAQNASTLNLSGSLADNRLGGIVSWQSAAIDIHRARIDRTKNALRIVGFENIEVGDGIHIVAAPGATHRLADLTLEGNERAGVLFDLAGTTLPAGAIDRIDVSATSSAAFGVILQNGQTFMGWDSLVTRRDHAAANDAAFTGKLDTVEGVGPCYMPAADFRREGLRALLGF